MTAPSAGISRRKVLEAGEPEKTGIPRGVMDLVRDGVEDAEGNVLWRIISGIRACGYDVEEIWDIVATEPNGIAKGYGERLRAEVGSVYAKLQKIDDNKSGPRDDEQRERKRPNGGEDAKRDFEARVGTGVGAGAGAGRPQRFKLTPFDQIKMNTASDCVIEGIIPKGGFVVTWGPPKCGKSFIVFDWMMHVALGLPYHGHYVEQGTVVYLRARRRRRLRQAQGSMGAPPRRRPQGEIAAVLPAQRSHRPRRRSE
jgi:AAA domain